MILQVAIIAMLSLPALLHAADQWLLCPYEEQPLTNADGSPNPPRLKLSLNRFHALLVTERSNPRTTPWYERRVAGDGTKAQALVFVSTSVATLATLTTAAPAGASCTALAREEVAGVAIAPRRLRAPGGVFVYDDPAQPLQRDDVIAPLRTIGGRNAVENDIRSR